MKEKFDIIVVGGGFAGSAAAIAAARQGKKVLLVEKYNCLGGAAVFNLVNPFMPYATRDPKGGEPIVLSRGLFGEVVKRLDEMGGLRKKDKSCFNEEILKYGYGENSDPHTGEAFRCRNYCWTACARLLL